jgi:hypothetical protein
VEEAAGHLRPEVGRYLAQRASFLSDIARGTTRGQAEEASGSLAHGFATGDGLQDLLTTLRRKERAGAFACASSAAARRKE